jgi:hypothetical protein
MANEQRECVASYFACLSRPRGRQVSDVARFIANEARTNNKPIRLWRISPACSTCLPPGRDRAFRPLSSLEGYPAEAFYEFTFLNQIV